MSQPRTTSGTKRRRWRQVSRAVFDILGPLIGLFLLASAAFAGIGEEYAKAAYYVSLAILLDRFTDTL